MGKQAKKRAQRKLPVYNERECGECTACCTVMGVKELDKVPFLPCSNLSTTSGCSIYEQRPQSCRDYTCAWKQGLGEQYHRPDQFGVVLAQTPKEVPAINEYALTVHEVRLGALDEPEVVNFLERVSQKVVVVGIKPNGKRRFMGDPAKVQAILAHASEMMKNRSK